jgi:hypothetical protein
MVRGDLRLESRSYPDCAAAATGLALLARRINGMLDAMVSIRLTVSRLLKDYA